jgi:hypothetical protein
MACFLMRICPSLLIYFSSSLSRIDSTNLGSQVDQSLQTKPVAIESESHQDGKLVKCRNVSAISFGA